MKEIQKRVAATSATEARFRDKPFDWAKGATCIHLLRYHARKMGHRLPVLPRFRTAISAKKKMDGAGFASLPDLMDRYFERIAPAHARVGDVVAMPGDQTFDALVLKVDKLKYLGWHESAVGCTIMEIDVQAALGAWRL